MKIGGLQKTTLVDFPGRVACTVFCQGCNFRCGFCHNGQLVSLEGRGQGNALPGEEIFGFLEKRRGILDGVCLTGGEPCLQNDLDRFCGRIKGLGLEVKLDTNGSRPEALGRLIERGLVDMVAMDVKNCFADYGRTIGMRKPEARHVSAIQKIKRSIKIILGSGLEYELRTTVVPGIHNRDSLMQLAEELRQLGGRDVVWVLQKFRASCNCLEKKYRQMESFSDEEMEEFWIQARKKIPAVRLRM